LIATMIFIMLAIWQASLVRYDYGLYKILFLGSLIWIPALFRGGTAVAHLIPRPIQPWGVAAGTILFFGGIFAQRTEQQIPWRVVRPVKWYSDLAGLKHIVADRPILLICDSIFDRDYNEFDQEWAAFFLRHLNVKIPVYHGYLAGFGSFMDRAKTPSEPPAFVLVNGLVEGALWKNEHFSLLELGSEAKLIGVQGPGLGIVNSKPFAWLGKTATRFLLVSKNAQTAIFSAWLTGPGRPEDEKRQIGISIGGNTWQTEASGALSIQVPLKAGLNYLDVLSEESPTVSARLGDGPKTLPLGLWDYQINNKDEVSN
jgi:hypothetical protein